MADCVFCGIAAKLIPSQIIYEDDLCLAFKDINPQAPTHFLLIPKEHIPSVAAVGPEHEALVGHMFTTIARLARETGIERGGYRVVSNVGAGAGQSVPHLHYHVLGGRGMAWPPG